MQKGKWIPARSELKLQSKDHGKHTVGKKRIPKPERSRSFAFAVVGSGMFALHESFLKG